jgi:hypothetical protein
VTNRKSLTGNLGLRLVDSPLVLTNRSSLTGNLGLRLAGSLFVVHTSRGFPVCDRLLPLSDFVKNGIITARARYLTVYKLPAQTVRRKCGITTIFIQICLSHKINFQEVTYGLRSFKYNFFEKK